MKGITMAIVSAHTSPLAEPPLAETPTVSTAITWTHIPLVAQVALVGRCDGMPVAVIDQIGSAGYRASLCSGKNVGVFRTLEECKQAVSAALENARPGQPA